MRRTAGRRLAGSAIAVITIGMLWGASTRAIAEPDTIPRTPQTNAEPPAVYTVDATIRSHAGYRIELPNNRPFLLRVSGDAGRVAVLTQRQRKDPFSVFSFRGDHMVKLDRPMFAGAQPQKTWRVQFGSDDAGLFAGDGKPATAWILIQPERGVNHMVVRSAPPRGSQKKQRSKRSTPIRPEQLAKLDPTAPGTIAVPPNVRTAIATWARTKGNTGGRSSPRNPSLSATSRRKPKRTSKGRRAPEKQEPANETTQTKTRQSDAVTPLDIPKQLRRFVTDLTSKAQRGQLEAMVGREPYFRRLVRGLLGSERSNTIILGDHGAGKTQLVDELARRLAAGTVPDRLKGMRIAQVSLGGSVSGTPYRGQLEERITQLFDWAEKTPNLVVFIDEIHCAFMESTAEVMKERLTSPNVHVIGATTEREFRQHIEGNAAFADRFSLRVRIPSMNAKEFGRILGARTRDLGNAAGIRIRPSAVQAAVELASLRDGSQMRGAMALLEEALGQAELDGRKHVTPHRSRRWSTTAPASLWVFCGARAT